jgi:hypothetical protein
MRAYAAAASDKKKRNEKKEPSPKACSKSAQAKQMAAKQYPDVCTFLAFI